MKVAVNTREELHILIRFLADAIDPKHFDDMPIFFIKGKTGTAKSLVADIFFKSFDDISFYENTRNEDIPISHKFSRETEPLSATDTPSFFETLSAGIARQFMFRSGFGYKELVELNGTVEKYKELGGKSGVIIATGRARGEHEKIALEIDFGDWTQEDEPPAILEIKSLSPLLQNCSRFSTYINVLETTSNLFDLEQPTPEIWQTPEIV